MDMYWPETFIKRGRWVSKKRVRNIKKQRDMEKAFAAAKKRKYLTKPKIDKYKSRSDKEI